MNNETEYATIAEAEAVLVAAGYRRDAMKAVWVSYTGGAVRVIRTPENKFKISRNNA